MEKVAKSAKLITAKEVQEEYLNVDIRKVRQFLNTYCRYRKIGHQYFYLRSEVEEKLLNQEASLEYDMKHCVKVYQLRKQGERRQRA